jgi:hypothetical protein
MEGSPDTKPLTGHGRKPVAGVATLIRALETAFRYSPVAIPDFFPLSKCSV